jgi:hypothetical protein
VGEEPKREERRYIKNYGWAKWDADLEHWVDDSPDPPPTQEEMLAYRRHLIANEPWALPSGEGRPWIRDLLFRGHIVQDLSGPQLREWRAFVKENCS